MAKISSRQTLHLILPVQYMIMMSYSSLLSHYLFILLVGVITYRCEYFVLWYRYVYYCFIFLICILVVVMHRWVGELIKSSFSLFLSSFHSLFLSPLSLSAYHCAFTSTVFPLFLLSFLLPTFLQSFPSLSFPPCPSRKPLTQR